MECVVCCQPTVDPELRSRRSRRTCPYSDCNFQCCVECLQRYILSVNDDARCMQCHKPFSAEVMQLAFGSSFLEGAYREHREQILLAREQALMPTTMALAAYVRAASVHKACMLELRHVHAQSAELQLAPKRDQMAAFAQTMEAVRVCYERCADAASALQSAQTQAFGEGADSNVQATMGSCVVQLLVACNVQVGARAVCSLVPEGATVVSVRGVDVELSLPATGSGRAQLKLVPVRRAYLRPCPASACNGFLSSAWRCPLCDTHVCHQCHAVRRENHVCSADDLATADALRLDTKPCPKCAAPVYKSGGCDQMFCTACNTSFSWRTLAIVTRNFHNPHYFEWLFRNPAPGPRALTDCLENAGAMMERLRAGTMASAMQAQLQAKVVGAGTWVLDAVARSSARPLLRDVELLTANDIYFGITSLLRLILDADAQLNNMTMGLETTTLAMQTFSKSRCVGISQVEIARDLVAYARANGDDETRAANEDLRLAHLLGMLDATALKQTLLLRERRRARQVEKVQLLRMYIDVLSELLFSLFQWMQSAPALPLATHTSLASRAPPSEVRRIVHQMAELRSYVNRCAERMAARTHCATFVVDEKGEVSTYTWPRPERNVRARTAPVDEPR